MRKEPNPFGSEPPPFFLFFMHSSPMCSIASAHLVPIRRLIFDFYSDFSKNGVTILEHIMVLVHSDIILVMHPLKSGFYNIL